MAAPSRPWRLVDDQPDRAVIDIAAGIPIAPRSLTAELLVVAIRHGLLGLIDPASTVDASALLASRARWEARRVVMEERLRSILVSLAEADVPAAVLKGPFLGHHVYPQPRLRAFTDLDVLVPRHRLGRALEVIGEEAHLGWLPPKGPKADKRDIVFRDPSGVRFNLDLHWDLFSYRQLEGCAATATDEAWGRARFEASDPLGPLYWLPDGALYAFLCTHAILDHRFRLILFRDLAEWAKRDLDWDEVVDFAGRHYLTSFVYLASHLAKNAVGAEIPQSTLNSLRRRSTAIGVAERLLPQTDLVRFDGHARHPLNLTIMLLHDNPRARAHRVARAPFAFFRWRQRVAAERVPKRPSVVVMVTSDQRRGAEVFGEQLVAGLEHHGWAARLVALSAPAGGHARVAAQVLDMTGAGPAGLRPRILARLVAATKAARAEVVLANGGATLRYAVVAFWWRPGRPRIVYSSIGEPTYWLRNRRHRLLQTFLLRRCDLVLAVSEATRGQLIDQLGLPADRVMLAHTGVSPDWLRQRRHPRDPSDHYEFRLVFIGSLSSEKDPMAAIEAVGRVEVPVRLRFVGDGPLRARLEAKGAEVIGGRVEFTGAVTDVAPHLAWADALVLTSRTEGLPGVVLEASAAGVPVIAGRVGGVAEAVIDGRTGIVVPRSDPHAMAAAITRLATDPGLAAEMGESGRRHVAERFLFARSIERYHQLLISVLERGRR